MAYKTFTDLMNVMGSFNNDITDQTKIKAALEFYRYWGNYLDTLPAFVMYLMKPLGGLAKVLYYVTNSLEKVFDNMFKLFGLFGYLGNNDTLIGKFFYYFQILGVSIFILLLLVRAITGLFGKSLKYKDAIKHFMLVTLVIAVLPQAITKISTTMATDFQHIQSVNNGSNEEDKTTFNSLALNPLKNNVVDLKLLIENNFDTSKYPLDNMGFINPKLTANNINDTNHDSSDFISNLDFSANYGATDSELLDNLEKGQNGEGLKGLFLHLPNSDQTGINTVTEHRAWENLNNFEPVYPRYKVNWIGMFAQYATLIILLVMMSIKVVKSIFEMILTAIIAPIQGYASVESSKKFKELLMTIVGGIAGIFFEIIIMRITLEIMRDLPDLAISGLNPNSNSFFSGLNMWEKCLSSIIVYIGVFFGAMQGVTIIERWLGVSTGHSDTAQQIMGAAMMANAVGSGVKGVAHGALGAGGMALGAAKGIPHAIGRIGGGTAKGIAGASGAAKGITNAVKANGLSGAAKAGLNNTKSALGGGIKNAGGKLKESGYQPLKDNFENKEESLNNFFTPKDPKDPKNPPAGNGDNPPNDPPEDPPNGGGGGNFPPNNPPGGGGLPPNDPPDDPPNGGGGSNFPPYNPPGGGGEGFPPNDNPNDDNPNDPNYNPKNNNSGNENQGFCGICGAKLNPDGSCPNEPHTKPSGLSGSGNGGQGGQNGIQSRGITPQANGLKNKAEVPQKKSQVSSAPAKGISSSEKTSSPNGLSYQRSFIPNGQTAKRDFSPQDPVTPLPNTSVKTNPPLSDTEPLSKETKTVSNSYRPVSSFEPPTVQKKETISSNDTVKGKQTVINPNGGQQVSQQTKTTTKPKMQFQKAEQDFQKMKSVMDQGTQKMMASSHSHIRGAEIDDDE